MGRCPVSRAPELLTTLTQVRDFRRLLGTDPRTTYVCFEDYVVDRGQAFTLDPLTSDEQAIVARAYRRTHFRPIPRGCFGNAQRLVLNDATMSLCYAEGYAASVNVVGFPVHHGWATINGKVIDPTWDERGTDYFGVHFLRAEFLAVALSGKRPSGGNMVSRGGKRGALWSVIDNYEDQWPELRRPRLPARPEGKQ